MADFENSAGKLFLYLYKQFEVATNPLDRKKDENVFLQTGSQYTYTLKQPLTERALKLMEEYKGTNENISHIQQTFTQRIEAYVNEFRQKVKQL